MKKVLVLTKTNWKEAPRLRHQLTRLLKKNNFDIHYVEKNTFWTIKTTKRIEEGILIYNHPELIHHQLRYNKFFQWLNNFVVKFYLRKLFKTQVFDHIINFNYDYSFIDELFPNVHTITLINDDFESMAKFGMKKQK